MTLNIKDAETDRLVRELAAETGESITETVEVSVRERLERVRGAARRQDLLAEIGRIAERVAVLPQLDGRSPEAILGYDEDGLPA